ncbi:MAG: C40 family peptidase [Flavobacterium sp.]|nr:C40 family peptidase [Flavobacterium sp.]
MKKSKLIRYANIGFFILIICVIVYVISDKDKAAVPKNTASLQASAAQPIANSLRDSIVEYGMSLLGTPYVTAGCSVDGFDCSGFVYFVFQNFDVKVPRSSAQFEHFGTEVAIDDVQKGDLLLFLSPTRNAIGHMGIVSKADGMNSDFIHSSSGREMKVIVTSLSNEGYTRRFVKAVRVL